MSTTERAEHRAALGAALAARGKSRHQFLTRPAETGSMGARMPGGARPRSTQNLGLDALAIDGGA